MQINWNGRDIGESEGEGGGNLLDFMDINKIGCNTHKIISQYSSDILFICVINHYAPGA